MKNPSSGNKIILKKPHFQSPVLTHKITNKLLIRIYSGAKLKWTKS